MLQKKKQCDQCILIFDINKDVSMSALD